MISILQGQRLGLPRQKLPESKLFALVVAAVAGDFLLVMMAAMEVTVV
jgi:hypothetical protein